MPVHDVDMNPIGASAGDGPDFFAEFREISGKYRGRDDQRRHLVLPAIVALGRMVEQLPKCDTGHGWFSVTKCGSVPLRIA
jgi:hypothetical protein